MNLKCRLFLTICSEKHNLLINIFSILLSGLNMNISNLEGVNLNANMTDLLQQLAFYMQGKPMY